MRRIVGYTSAPSVAPGQEISCHVSLLGVEAGATSQFGARLVRITGTGPNGSERCELIDSPLDAEAFTAHVQPTAHGSYALAKLRIGDHSKKQLLTLQVGFQPTRDAGVEQVLMALADDGHELVIGLDSERRPFVSAAGDAVLLERPAEVGQWYTLTAALDREGAVEIRLTGNDGGVLESRSGRMPAVPQISESTVTLAGHQASLAGGTHPVACFTGRLEDPLVGVSHAPLNLATHDLREAAARRGELVALWDFGASLDRFDMVDISGHDNRGALHGLPERAVTGSTWDAKTTSLHAAPEQYRAAHFWADAIEDAAWPAAFSLRVPDTMKSGVYGFRLGLGGGDDAEVIPFTVRPRSETASEVVLLLPTATYMAYSNARFTWEKVNWEVQRDRSVELGRSEQLLLDHPELGASSYDQYLDGANITLVSWLRPNLDMRSAQRREENYPSDLRLIDWLEAKGYHYDVLTEHDLDRAGVEILSPHQVVITGTHPEYVSSRCMLALSEYVAAGGRLAVLGGNAFHYTVAFSAERPWVMEVRKPFNRPAGSRAAAEGAMALTGEDGASSDAARPGEALLGTTTASMGFDGGRPYKRLPDSYEDPASFVFDGVDGAVVGDGGAFDSVVHQEWDNTSEVPNEGRLDVFDRMYVLARSPAATVNARWFGATKRRNRGEMTLSIMRSGGGVFSAASMAWCLCLNQAAVSRITQNVLDRFIDPQPL